MSNHTDEYELLLEVALGVAREAAELTERERRRGLEVGTKSTATDLVTGADRAVERLIADLLRRRRPADALLGEEYGAGLGPARSGAGTPAQETRVTWVVDPIDGTVNYVYGIPIYAVSIAAQIAGVTVVGVVRNPATGEQWSAVRGGGAWRDGKRLVTSQVDDLGRCLVATGFGYDAARRAHQAGVVAQLLPRVRDIRRLGAASLDLCYVAEGRVDAFFERGLNLWDQAAGELIAIEAGARVGGLRGAAAGPDMVLAAPPLLYDQLADLLAALDADTGP